MLGSLTISRKLCPSWAPASQRMPREAGAVVFQGKQPHVQFSAATDEGHGTVKRKPTAFIRRVPEDEEEEEMEDDAGQEDVQVQEQALCRLTSCEPHEFSRKRPGRSLTFSVMCT